MVRRAAGGGAGMQPGPAALVRSVAQMAVRVRVAW